MGLFSSLSVVPPGPLYPKRSTPLTDAAMKSDDPHHAASVEAPIFKLPPEIIQIIFSYLEAQHLASLLRACQKLRSHASQDSLWLSLLRLHLPEYDMPPTPSPAPTYHGLYLAHHPYWFLPRQRIWFSDDAYYGRLIVVKFNPSTGSISGYRLATERPAAVPQTWSIKPSVIIHHVEPRVYVSTGDPVLHLSYPPTRDLVGRGDAPWTPASEVRMRVGRPEQKINASLMLSKDLPQETAATPNVSVWPPRKVPNMPRTRSSSGGNSASGFTSQGHKPSKLDEISQTSFRLRTWTHFTQGMLSLGVRLGDEVSTWSTLSPELYTPTKEKPYQGLFVGDYASHGCEFLLVLQTDQAPPRTLPIMSGGDNDGGDDDGAGARRRNFLNTILAALREQQYIDEEDMDLIANQFDDTQRSGQQRAHPHSTMASGMGNSVQPNVPDDDGCIHRGAIEAVKITGDVNVPRGEHTFIADDIGPGGLIRIAHEHPFRGARVVRSRGHVAARGFRDDSFIPSQLFLINPDLLAQYWLPFGHISFYKRIDLDALMRSDVSARRQSE